MCKHLKGGWGWVEIDYRRLLSMTDTVSGVVQVVQGNSNTYASEIRPIDPPVIARRLRFLPFSSYPKTVCMRVELYGCPWTGRLRCVYGNGRVERGGQCLEGIEEAFPAHELPQDRLHARRALRLPLDR